VNYRAYIVSGRPVPTTGWEVLDGGFQMVLTEEARRDELRRRAYGAG
jgi:hypothetical protein